jgi:cystathionine gamma-lyase
MSVPAFEGLGTACIHAGQAPDPISGAVIFPISLSTTFAQKSPGVKYEGGFEYSRSDNPTRRALEACIASIENAQHGLAFASGLAATATLLSTLHSGSHVVCIDDVYGGTQRYFNKVAGEKYGMTFSFVDLAQPGSLQAALTPKTKLVWVETPTNPTLKIVDIRALADVAHAAGCLLVVDNTFMSPYFQRPLDLGADVVLHSCTKYLNGHSDAVMGALALNSKELHTQLKYLQNAIGAVPSPFDCFLVMRGLKTLHVRMREHQTNALAVARMLEGHPKVERVLYPGLPSHPQHDIAKRQMTGYGGMITFFIKGGLSASRTFLENLKLFALAESLGGVESLAEHPAIMTHASVPAERRAELGISDSLIRLSVGIEDLKDIVADVTTALDAVKL